MGHFSNHHNVHCYHEQQKQDTLLMSITSQNINRFSKLFKLDSAQNFLQ